MPRAGMIYDADKRGRDNCVVDAENIEHSPVSLLGSWKHNKILYTFVQITMAYRSRMWQAKNMKRVCAIDLEHVIGT